MSEHLYAGGTTHHISVTSGSTIYPFMLVPDITGWREVDISDFAPRVASGNLAYRDLSLWQVWAQEDWRHGFGFPYQTDESGYAKTGTGVDTRHKDVAMLATAVTSSETAISVAKFLDFGADVYALKPSNGGVRKYTVSSGTWAATAETTGTCLDGLSIGTYLVVALDGARMRKFDGTTWSNVGSDSNPPNDMAHLCLHGGYFWASEDGKNWLHWAEEEDLSDLEGGEDADTAAIHVGPGDIPIVNMISYGGQLYVAREDGAWVVGDDLIARQLMPFSTERHANNFKTMCVWKGHLYFSLRHRLYRYTGSTLIDVTPPRYDEVFPYMTYGEFENLTPRGNHLYVTARDTETTWNEVLLCYDGVGWHKLLTLTTSPYVVNVMNLSTTTDRLWLNYTGAAVATAYISLQSLSDLPYATFPVTGDHFLYSSKFDAGFVDVRKTWRSMRVRTNNCSATQTISVDYAIDDGAWGNIGQITTSPYQELFFPDCDIYSTHGKFIQLRFNLKTAAAAQSPILESFAVKYMLRPTAVWGWQANIVIADRLVTLQGRVQHEFTADEQIAALRTMRDATCPVTLTDPWGTEHAAYISSINISGAEWKQSESIQTIARVSFADAS